MQRREHRVSECGTANLVQGRPVQRLPWGCSRKEGQYDLDQHAGHVVSSILGIILGERDSVLLTSGLMPA